MQGWGPRRRAVPPAHTENLAQPVTYNSGFVRRVCAGGLCGHGLSTALQCPHGGVGWGGQVWCCPMPRTQKGLVCGVRGLQVGETGSRWMSQLSRALPPG